MLFTGLNSPRITIGLHWHPLRKPVPTGAVHRVRCVCISNRVHLCDVDPQAHICDVNPHTDTDWCACGCGTTVEADHADSHTRLAFLIESCIELDVMSFHGQNSSFFESRSFGKHYIQVSPPNNYDSRHQVSSQNLESRRRSKRGHVSWWSFDVIKIGERAFVHFYTRIVQRLLTNKKYMCMCELVHSRVISCEKFCWITLLDILLTSSCRHRPCTWTWRFIRLQILNAIWELWRSSFGAKVVQSWP